MVAKSLLVLALAAIGSSFTLPGGLENGAYRAYFNEAGVEVHERLPINTTSPVPTSRSKRHPLSPRAIQIWCGCDRPMNTGDTNIANDKLASSISGNPQISPGWTFYVVQETAIAFVCNKDKMVVNVPPYAVKDGSWDISTTCGLFIAGTSRLDGPVALDYGYMQNEEGLSLCEDAQKAKTSSCCLPGSKRFANYGACMIDYMVDHGNVYTDFKESCDNKDRDCAPSNPEEWPATQ